MGTGRRRLEDIFIIRMWSEANDSGVLQWRASVLHVATQERRYFTQYAQLCEFLDHWRFER
jgi:hypothetical protein